MDGALGQQLTVVKKDHPAGERGVRTSLDIVAKKVAEGGNHPKVRAWAVEQLERARRETGQKMNTDRQRAEALLGAVQKKLWIPDPVGTEFMAGAHLMACDRSTPEEICFLSGDCDDEVILLGACFLSVGLHTMVVGHSYDRDKNIQHVLLAARVRKQGGTGAITGGQHAHEWVYADPSLPHLRFGQVTAFTRERLLSVPNVQVICDANSCLVNRDFDPDELGFVERGVFVGVDGVPERAPKSFAWLGSSSSRFDWLGQTSSEVANNVINECQKTVTNADLSTAASRAQSFETAGKCAAEALCEYYSGGAVPPGVCSSIAGPVLNAVVDVWNSIFGGPSGIDCSKVSTVDPCHPCNLLAWQMQKCPLFGAGSSALQSRSDCLKTAGLPPACDAWKQQQAENARSYAVAAANETIFNEYDAVWNAVNKGIVAKFSGDTTKAAAFYGAHPELNYVDYFSTLDRSAPETGPTVTKATVALDKAYQAATGQPSVLPADFYHCPSGEVWLDAAGRCVNVEQFKQLVAALAPKRAASSAVVPVALGLGAAGVLAWLLFLR